MARDAQLGEHPHQATADLLETGRVEGLNHVIERAFAQERLANLGVGAGTDDQDWHSRLFAAHDSEKGERADSTSVKHGNVERDQGRRDGAEEVERRQGIFGLRHDLASETLEVMTQDVADEDGIINHQDTHSHQRTIVAPAWKPVRAEAPFRV